MVPGKIKPILACLVFPAVGMAAAVATMGEPEHTLSPILNPLGSLYFGVAIALCLWAFFDLRSIARTIVFVVASIAAAFLSLGTGVWLFDRFPKNGWESPLDRRFVFIVCYVGAFVVLATVLFLLFRQRKAWLILTEAACWSLAGGGLGVIGYLSGDWFGRVRSYFGYTYGKYPNSQSLLFTWNNSELALMLVWQTGMGLVIALALWMEQRRLLARALATAQ